MVLSLKVINSDSSLNNFQDIGAFQLVRGSTSKLRLQLFQNDKKIRYVPTSSAVITLALLKSDNTTLTKTATFPFADDRSIIEIDLTALDTASLISQNLSVTVTEGANVSYAIIQNSFQMISLTGC